MKSKKIKFKYKGKTIVNKVSPALSGTALGKEVSKPTITLINRIFKKRELSLLGILIFSVVIFFAGMLTQASLFNSTTASSKKLIPTVTRPLLKMLNSDNTVSNFAKPINKLLSGLIGKVEGNTLELIQPNRAPVKLSFQLSSALFGIDNKPIKVVDVIIGSSVTVVVSIDEQGDYLIERLKIQSENK